jgi:selenocysteine-specific elongation factor
VRHAGESVVNASSGPLTVGTAGHVDHGKTALVAALTGTDTDRLAQEKARGLSIDLGFAVLDLPSGRRLSVIDVPGHERFIRTMVAGATGIDCYMMVIAATEGVRRQTAEHARILHALSIEAGIVVITKTDLADPSAAIEEAQAILPGAPVVICPPFISDRRLPVLGALDQIAQRLVSRATLGGPAIMHVDRCFTITGAGTVVTGTLASGQIKTGDRLTVYPDEFGARVRGVQVHGSPVAVALAGQRVAVNLARVPHDAIARGDVVADRGAVHLSHVIDIELGGSLRDAANGVHRVVHVHHGTRATPARLRRLSGSGPAQLRCQRPLITRPGDAIVLRDAAGRETLGGAVVSRSPRPRRPAGGQSMPAGVVPASGDAGAGLRGATVGPREPDEGSGRHPDHARPPLARELVLSLEQAESEIRALIADDGWVTLPGLRDRLGVSRSQAKTFLDYFDAHGLTLRRADDTRVLRRSPKR